MSDTAGRDAAEKWAGKPTCSCIDHSSECLVEAFLAGRASRDEEVLDRTEGERISHELFEAASLDIADLQDEIKLLHAIREQVLCRQADMPFDFTGPLRAYDEWLGKKEKTK